MGILIAILALVWQSARVIVTRMVLHHLPHLGSVTVHIDPDGQGGERHHRIGAHAQIPVDFIRAYKNGLAAANIEMYR